MPRIARRENRSRRLHPTRSFLSHAQGQRLLAPAVSPLSLGVLLPALVRLLVLRLVLSVPLLLRLLTTRLAAVALPAKTRVAHAEDRATPAADARNEFDGLATRHRDKGEWTADPRSGTLTRFPTSPASHAAAHTPAARHAAGVFHCARGPLPPGPPHTPAAWSMSVSAPDGDTRAVSPSDIPRLFQDVSPALEPPPVWWTP